MTCSVYQRISVFCPVSKSPSSSRLTCLPSSGARATQRHADGERPEGQLVPRQQVAAEGEQQRENEEEHADHPSAESHTPR